MDRCLSSYKDLGVDFLFVVTLVKCNIGLFITGLQVGIGQYLGVGLLVSAFFRCKVMSFVMNFQVGICKGLGVGFVTDGLVVC